LVGDVVLLEVLLGAVDERHARNLEIRLSKYQIVAMLDGGLATQAAANYRRLRNLGTTIRTVADIIIGTFCIAHDHVLLQSDRDFQPMAEHLGLRLA
jgi:predicted nucleic acid-binding protein